jgi:hypothetical protein
MVQFLLFVCFANEIVKKKSSIFFPAIGYFIAGSYHHILHLFFLFLYFDDKVFISASAVLILLVAVS